MKRTSAITAADNDATANQVLGVVLRLAKAVHEEVSVFAVDDKVKILDATREWPFADSFYGHVVAVDLADNRVWVAFEDGSNSWCLAEGLEAA